MSQIIQRNLQKTRKETIAVSDDKQIRFDVSVDHGSFSPSHWHEAIEIIYVLEGSAVVTLFDLTITLKPGQMLLINSGLVHASRCPSGNRTILMQIPDDLLLSFLPDVSHLWFVIDYDSPNPEVQENIQRLRNLLLDMMRLQENGRSGYLLGFQRDLFEFLDLLYRKFLQEMPVDYHPKSSRVLSRLDAVLSYTHQNYRSPITLKEAAQVAALQPEYFCRFFKENMGTTYLQYLNDYRLSCLYRDLVATDRSIRELEEIFHCPMKEGVLLSSMHALQQRGVRNVLVSCGEKGAYLLDEHGGFYFGKSPAGRVINTTGAGDAMVAGFLKGWMQTNDYMLAFKRGIAAGSATAFCKGMADAESVKRLYAKVDIEIMREPVMEG